MRSILFLSLTLSACVADPNERSWEVDESPEAPPEAHVVPRIELEVPDSDAACASPAQTWRAPEAHAQRCLDEVFGPDGCLSARISYAYDADGLPSLERSEICTLNFLPGACGPYGDVPRDYLRRWSRSQGQQERTESSGPDAPPQQRLLETWDDQGRLTQQREQFWNDEAWRDTTSESWTYDSDGRQHTHRTTWGAEAFYEARLVHDERGRVIAEFHENQRQAWQALERTYEAHGLAIEEHYSQAGDLTRRVTYAYDDEGALVATEFAFRADEAIPLVRTHTSETQRTREHHNRSTERWELASVVSLDAQGREAAREHWAAGERRSRTTITRNALGKTTLEHTEHADGSKSTTAWLYDPQGRLLQTQHDFDDDGTSDRTETFLHDAHGNLREHRQDLDGDGAIDQRAVTHRSCQ